MNIIIFIMCCLAKGTFCKRFFLVYCPQSMLFVKVPGSTSQDLTWKWIMHLLYILYMYFFPCSLLSVVPCRVLKCMSFSSMPPGPSCPMCLSAIPMEICLSALGLKKNQCQQTRLTLGCLIFVCVCECHSEYKLSLFSWLRIAHFILLQRLALHETNSSQPDKVKFNVLLMRQANKLGERNVFQGQLLQISIINF